MVITGLGVISPLGSDCSPENEAEHLIARLRRRTSGVVPLTQIPADALPIAAGGQAGGFTGDISQYGEMDKKLQRTIRKGSKVMCREIEMGVAVAQRALSDAGLTAENRDPDRTGVIYGCDYIISLPEEYAAGIAKCMDADGRFDFGRWGQEGRVEVNPLWLLKYLPNMPASHIAIYNDLRGPNNSITIREASAGAAVGEAVSTLQRGHADALVVGSTGSRIHPLRTLHASLQEDLASNRDDVTTMSRPFGADRDGAVVGEGAAAMVMETREHAEARGAKILGEVVAASSSAVWKPHEAPEHSFRQAFRNVYAKVAQDRPGDIGHIHAHGLGTVAMDAAEAAAISDVFGPPNEQPPVTTAKGHFGNLGGGSGLVEAVCSLLACGGDLFPILNLDAPAADCPLNACTDDSVPAGNEFVSANMTPQGQATAVRMRRCSAD